ncbi:sterol desaturase family protein [Maribacter sp. PR1]|uniref:Sterol desaturase family protein n=1 Tax=Maribacter cobaltidurans TaxID=1178778 RepID=A0ABU7IXH5_9FLAO|nr:MULTISPECIES: sterol desaturase family protein [Maribacter]MDC6390143.1 sterol desaturase family protein [Maribacter sp. PR1]MEE1977533.1 sterol desaturase family protein [Maribacter cobaltidurans]
METYATALLYAIPFFILLLGIEILYGHVVKDQKHSVLDTVSSISSGLTNIIKDSLGIVLVLVSYPFLLKLLAITHIEVTWVTWVVGFIAIDFAGYWNHRLSHKVNFFWNQHVIHHSSESFNLACALRQSISNLLGYFPFLLIPAALLGVPNKVIAILAPIQLFAQFWYHTQHIGKMGWLEYIIVTPSQHRVHHAINPEYIDKNLGQVFCVWDRLFGTFQEELPDVVPQYGILKPAKTWNPIRINFQHLWRLMMDARRTKSFWDKFRIWFMPTGWRPNDVRDKYPMEIITDVYNFERYKTPTSKIFNVYIIFQLVMSLLLLLYMFGNYGNLSTTELLVYGGIVFTGIYGYTSLMDGETHAIWIEVLRGIVGILIIILTGDWFDLNSVIPFGVSLIVFYNLITIAGGAYFTATFKKKNVLV